MAVTPVDKEYLTLHFSEFASDEILESRVRSLNDTAELFLAESVLGTKTRYARMLFIAHMLKLSINEGNGAVTSRKVGDLSESYAQPMSDEALQQTGYGKALFDLIRIHGRGDIIFYGP